jgi:tetratricopeptide (TPR) repeat protein
MDSTRLPRHTLCAICARAALCAALAGAFATSFAQAPAPAKGQAPAPAAGQAPAAAGQADAFRPEIAKPLQAAEAAIREKKYDEALKLIREAESVADRTPAESVIIERVRATAAFNVQDYPTAIRSFEMVIGSGRLSPGDQAKMVQVVAQLYFQTKDYPKAATWAARALKESGENPDMRWLMISAQYLADDCTSASRELRTLVDAAAPPSREWLAMLSNCYIKLKDEAGYLYTLDKFLTYHPTRDHWVDAIRRVENKPGFSDRLLLDVLRLRRATGTFAGGSAYAVMTQLALKAALPAEAKKVSDEGFSTGALGTGPDADQVKQLRDAAAKAVADDEKQLPQNAKAGATAKDGTTLVNVGFAYVMMGQYDTGIPLMEQGIAKGGLRQPEDAKLHLGIAYLAAGQKPKAIQTFKEVGGTDGTADLARLWLIVAQRPA